MQPVFEAMGAYIVSCIVREQGVSKRAPQLRAMAAESRRPHLRFSEVLDETESDVTTNPSAKEDGSHGLQDEEGEEEEEEEDEEEDLQHKTKSVDDANFLSKLFWW